MWLFRIAESSTWGRVNKRSCWTQTVLIITTLLYLSTLLFHTVFHRQFRFHGDTIVSTNFKFTQNFRFYLSLQFSIFVNFNFSKFQFQKFQQIIGHFFGTASPNCFLLIGCFLFNWLQSKSTLTKYCPPQCVLFCNRKPALCHFIKNFQVSWFIEEIAVEE